MSSPEAPTSWYRPTPVYVGNEQPTGEVRAWAETQPDFVTSWLDRDHNGWITVGFRTDVEQRQADLELLFPGVGVVAVLADWSVPDLLELQSTVTAAFAGVFVSTGTLEHMGVVEIDLGVMTPERLAVLDPFVGEPICIRGLPAATAVQPGPQPTGGDGWRLLGEDLTGPSYRTGVATDDTQYASLWATAGMTGDRPSVDFQDEIVIWFGTVFGSSCPIRLDDVIVDRGEALVHPMTVVPSNQTMCTGDANAHAYVVAVSRSMLPVGPFTMQLGAEDPPVGAPEERTLVGVDLSAPGSTAADAELGTDPALMNADGRNWVASGGTISIGDSWPYRFPADCGARVLGVVNGVLWETTEVAAGELPGPWQSLIDADGVITVEIVLGDTPPSLVASANGASITYAPSTADRAAYDWRSGNCVAR